MKATIIYFVACTLFAVISLVNTDDREDAVEKAFEECVETFPVEETILQKLEKGEVVDDENLKEALFCVSKKIGYQNEDGSLEVQFIKDDVAVDAGDHRFEEDIEKCCQVKSQSSQEIAFIVTKCFMDIYAKIDKQT